MKQIKIILPLSLTIILFGAFTFAAQQPAQQATLVSTPSLVFSTPEQMQEDILAVPCKDNERLNGVKTLFEKMGAPAEDISIEKIKDVENIIIRKAGKTADEKIIIGAHYDLAGEGSCGAVDNWTGIVAIAHIYKTLKNLPLNKTILFVGFGKEEKGLVGSKAMAKAIKKEELNQYCAMINIDSLGMNTPQVLANVSDKKLNEAAADLAKQMKLQFQSITIPNASSDSASFQDRKIPALTISEIPNDWMKIFHSKNDQAEKVNAISEYLGYRLALALLGTVDEKECGEFRK